MGLGLDNKTQEVDKRGNYGNNNKAKDYYDDYSHDDHYEESNEYGIYGEGHEEVPILDEDIEYTNQMKQIQNDNITMLQIKKSFKPFRFGGRDYDYDEWDQYARIDGWVCRNDRDCSWLDPRLGCNDYEFSINLINVCIKSYL